MKKSKGPDFNFQKQATPINQNSVLHPSSIIQRVRFNPKSLTSADVLQLQRTIGNRAVGRLLSEIRNPSKVQQVSVQRHEIPEGEESLQGKMAEIIQRQEIPEEEEPLQGMFESKPEKENCPSCIQMQEIQKEEPLQGKMIKTVQRLKIPEEEEKLQRKPIVQREKIPDEEESLQGKMIGTVQRQEIPQEKEPLQMNMENKTGMPDNLKAGVESLSGIDMSDVRVYYNSSKPAEVGALANTQGTDIHVASGQERHLPHEGWHVAQQMQGRVKPTMQAKGVSINDDAVLEREADVMGIKTLTNSRHTQPTASCTRLDGRASSEKGETSTLYFLSPEIAKTFRSGLQTKASRSTAVSAAHSARISTTKQLVRRKSLRRGPRKAKWLREYESKVQAVKTFMEKQVAPWATQARIAELINENMEDMVKDESISDEMTYLDPSKHRKYDSAYTPQIAPGNTRFLAPSRGPGRIEGEKTVVHRGDLEIEMHEGQPCVRVYSAIWAEARPNEKGRITHKDIHQDPKTGAIIVHTGRDQGEASGIEDEGKPIMWVSGGQPLRQLKWFYKYPLEKSNPGAKPVVRSFLVPLSVWNEMSSQAVNEESARKEGNEVRPFNVDTAYAANQFGIRGPMLEKFRSEAIRWSLISYTGDPSHSLNAYGGRVVGIKRLHKKLGAPLTAAPLPVWVDPEKGEFVRTAKQQSLANSLMLYYGIWTGNSNFIPKEKEKIPKERLHAIFKDFLAKNGLELPEGYRLP